MKRILLIAFLFFSIFTIKISAATGDLENDKLEINDVKARMWTEYGNFTKLKANNGFNYKLFHDYYIEDLAMNKNVYVYFDLSKVTDSKVKSAIKGVISDFGNLNNSKIKMYSVTRPSVSHYTVKVRDFKNGATCSNSDSKTLACANNSKIDVLKNITKYNYTSADYKAILAHEFLHVFGIDHTSQTATGTLMGPNHNPTKVFKLSNYKNDVSAWNTLNAPFRVTTETSKGIKYKHKKFLNIYLDEKHTYESTGKYWKQSVYYVNGKQNKKVIYPGTATNKKIAEHFYESSGKYWKSSVYFDNDKRTSLVYYAGTAANPVVSRHTYESSGKHWVVSTYYENDGKTIKRKYQQNGTEENPIIKDWYYENGVIAEEIEYKQNESVGKYYKYSEIIYKNGKRSILTYYNLEEGSSLKSKHVYNESGTEWIESIYY